nr:uncharacterized protein LOC111506580 [Leptinotarsa decemlineata]
MKNLDPANEITNYVNETPYNIDDWVRDLQLETCALVAIGLKYFAIFLEDVANSDSTNKRSKNYFLGICQQNILEKWTFCSEQLSKKKKHKCKFKLGTDRYQGRVHRRFCDVRIMIGNKDCSCEQTIFGDEMYKVRGFPTCYISPLPSTLCKYNVCGVSQCTAKSVENTVHTVECDSKCRGGNPFCEYPIDRSAKVPAVKSLWSKWREQPEYDVGEKLSVASCINTFTGEGDLDCLGPGYACCDPDSGNCTCRTFEEQGVLKVERIIHQNTEGVHYSQKTGGNIRHIVRYKKDVDDDDIEDDNGGEDDIDEDIILEDIKEKEEEPTATINDLDKDEMLDEFNKETEKELKIISKNNTVDRPMNRNGYSHNHIGLKQLSILTYVL